MIDLKQVHDMWQKDSIIDNTHLDETSRQTPASGSKILISTPLKGNPTDS